MFRIITIAVFVVSIASCTLTTRKERPWSKAYEQDQYDKLDYSAKQRISDDEERHKAVAFLLKRFKSELPNGIESVSRDSFENLAVKIGLEYANAVDPQDPEVRRTFVKWSPEAEQDLKNGFMQTYKAKSASDANEKCDCVISEVRKMYPDSIVLPLPNDTLTRIMKHCFVDKR